MRAGVSGGAARCLRASGALLLLAVGSSSGLGLAEGPRPPPLPLAAEVNVPADLPYRRLIAIARLSEVTTVLDATRAPLRRGRVDLLLRTAGVFGVRHRGAPTPTQVKLLRRLKPSLLILEVTAGEPLEALVAVAESIGVLAYRLELAAPPTPDELTLLRRLRPLTLRFALPLAAPKDLLAHLATFPGRIELLVDEAARTEWLSGLRWPSQAALVLAPRDGNYVADSSVASLASASRSRHVVRVSLPLRRVEVEQLRQLAGVSLELHLDKPPRHDALRSLVFAQGNARWPVETDGGALGAEPRAPEAPSILIAP